MDIIRNELFVSDIIVLISPSYWGDVTAQMKLFFDRSTPFLGAIPTGKIGGAIAIRAGKSPKENQDILNTFEHYFGHLGIRPVSSLSFEQVNEPCDLDRIDTLNESLDNFASQIIDQVSDNEEKKELNA
jgi:multimeric flavodoxin WrbA